MPFISPLSLSYSGIGLYVLTAPLVYRGAIETITVPAGTVTDLASVPRAVRWLLPQDGTYTTAAVLHDHLCAQLARPLPPVEEVVGPLTVIGPRDVDGLFRRTMREAEVPPLRRWLLWTGVRWGAAANPARRRGWWRDAPLVLLFSLLAAPLVVPTSLVVLVALAVYWLAEAAVSLLEVAR